MAACLAWAEADTAVDERGRCAEYLAKHPHHAAAEALARTVHRGGRFNEDQSALEALAALGDPRGRDLLIERLGPGDDLRRGFDHGLGQIVATCGDST